MQSEFVEYMGWFIHVLNCQNATRQPHLTVQDMMGKNISDGWLLLPSRLIPLTE
jgi:hypothetical protein